MLAPRKNRPSPRPGRQSRYVLANQILDEIRATRLEAGRHLVESALAERLGVSRTLARAAMKLLAGRGVVTARRNQGFFLARGWDQLDGEAVEVPQTLDDALYRRLVRERLQGRLPERLTQIALMERFQVDRSVLLRVLSRMADEGIVARNRGHGWSFLPTIDSDLALSASYDFRRALEPAGLRLASFHADPTVLERSRQSHLALSRRLEAAGDAELYELDERFHAMLAMLTGNSFWQQAIQQQNRLRRMLEYRSYGDRSRVRDWLREHLAIIRALAAGRREHAAELLGAHLDRAFRAAQRRAAARKEARLRAA
ncbi:MAG: GntR family transcriptional regulator [Acetobacteraceae bacterium]|nr:GntR family transcriptional regulator [Acetobacteraceae bacterium]